ncbi:DUF1987 domain-containing protein [Sulfuritalea hydrogenivorans]|jgi:hypothetical protein|uniref:Putative lipoprotein n=1 Tax=Sulfuritalea hydrogenivorans sk43H TaxID=1223802 RepID=W0SEE5_9PROT|nr:DUF1987 domain-containing protein [Sulfuritalea hydrogenivorans]MDK9713152.1 DUF1987 domain-containing protein [Sulfuritalea sp.]BAO29150.1 putative lipoprotein [Sulfuritalea hydrogenivorans sk43H]
MEDLHIPASNETPEIRFEFSRHRLSMHGESYPENAMSFYGPVRASLQSYLDQVPADSRIEVGIGLRYFNSSSTKLIRALVGMLDKAAENGPSISVDWLHDEDDDMMLEFGIDLKEEHRSLKFSTVVVEPA